MIPRSRRFFASFSACAALALAGPLSAQTLPRERVDGPKDQSEGLRDIGRTAETSVGEVGQRKEVVGLDPTGRLNNRVENRVQNRIRNRIDRSYDATANATAPLENAQSRSREGSRARPR